MKKHRSAMINNPQGERPAGIKIDRRSQERSVVDAESLLNRIIDAVKDKSAMGRQTALRKTRGARGQQDGEWIILADVHAGLNRALAVEKFAVTKIGDDTRLQETKIMRRLGS